MSTPLRLWPAVAIVAIQWLLRFGLPAVAPGTVAIGLLAAGVGGVLVVLWWLFFSRAPWVDRITGIFTILVATFATSRVVDVSIANGAQGALFFILAIPTVSLALVAGAAAGRRLPDAPRRAVLAAAIFLGTGVWTLARTGGFDGSFRNDLMWRWTKSPEERLLAQTVEEPVAPPPAPVVVVETPKAAPEPPPALVSTWPGFRGPRRDGVVRGVRIDTDWTAAPPVQLWRRPIGPGWSSFAVAGDLIFTQEQRGEEEIVACYHASTGKPVWRHRDRARFWESNAGAGPRATPAFYEDRVYTLGGTGIVNALDARTGAVVWTRSAAADTGAEAPQWGLSGSPLVHGDDVIVAASGRLIAYERATGKPRWTGPDAGTSYSSPQLATFDGVPQILLTGAKGAIGVSPADGTLLWQHQWKGYPIVQPALTAEGDILLSVNESSGTRRLAVAHAQNGWSVEERWTTNGLKPYFNDFVVHRGHAYGFDGAILACIDLADGKRKWKGGRYGKGQLVLLPDQDVLLVLSEEGELALVKATPDQYTELARRPGIEGKTWNHPVLVGKLLLVRNGEEMAAFRLSPGR